MTKNEITEHVMAQTKLRKCDVERILNSLSGLITEKLTDEGEFEWRDLGHFRVHEHKSRLFKMPDGKIVVKQQHKRVGFVAGSKLKKMV
ncbi:MAG TPA: HU family DNA-binding protein [Saprospiraceae bacterium]|jgi:nucleoid DNA-binding protein|nr:HU family DNA-binding protein [Saprospiraceae bacterium]